MREQGLGKAFNASSRRACQKLKGIQQFLFIAILNFSIIGYVDAKQYDIVMEELGNDDTLSVKFLTSDIASFHGMTVMLPEVFD